MNTRKIGPAWSLQGRRKEDKLPEIPGPGAYSSPILSSNPSYTMDLKFGISQKEQQLRTSNSSMHQ